MVIIDDISKLNESNVFKILYPANTNDCALIVKYAQSHKLTIIPRGTSHSMGGQTITTNGIVVDMKKMNRILNLDTNNFILTVESGILWSDVIYYLDTLGLSPQTLQSYSSFSVGGTVAVNAHGITSDQVMADCVAAIEIVDSQGDIKICSRYRNPELFKLALGGYGLFGIITKAYLRVTKNTRIVTKVLNCDNNNFNKIYKKLLLDPNINIKFARINITNMTNIILYIFIKIPNTEYTRSNLENEAKNMSKIHQLLYKWMLPNPLVQKLRFCAESMSSTPLDSNNESLITRNSLVYESASALSNFYNPILKLDKTHILQEYFIPTKKFETWMTILKNVFLGNSESSKITGSAKRQGFGIFTFGKYALLNITIRYVKKDNITFLPYAITDMYAFVLYFRIEASKDMDNYLKLIHNILGSYAILLGGTFYLPYRHHYSKKQLISAYPNIKKFVEMKKKYDPKGVFSNQWFVMIQQLLNGNK